MDIVIIFLLGALILVLLYTQKSIDNYEIDDLAFDMCRKDCLTKGQTLKKCSDPDVLLNCVDSMEKIIGELPPDVTFTPLSDDEE